VFGAIGLGHGTPGLYDERTLALLEEVGRQLAAALDTAVLHQEVLERKANQSALLGKLISAQEEERQSIANDLHDDTVQVITATLLSLDRVSSAIDQGRPDRVASAAAAARGTLSTAVERTRRLMFELRPPLLEANGLADAVRDLASAAEEDGQLEVEVEARVGRHPQPVEALAYRTIREAISNVRKHAHARHLRRLPVDSRRDAVLQLGRHGALDRPCQ
jgi:signal transduction histidine kinase